MWLQRQQSPEDLDAICCQQGTIVSFTMFVAFSVCFPMFVAFSRYIFVPSYRLGLDLPMRGQVCHFLGPTMHNGISIHQLLLNTLISPRVVTLLKNTYPRYPGPTGPDPSHVGAAYFGLVPKYQNQCFMTKRVLITLFAKVQEHCRGHTFSRKMHGVCAS